MLKTILGYKPRTFLLIPSLAMPKLPMPKHEKRNSMHTRICLQIIIGEFFVIICNIARTSIAVKNSMQQMHRPFLAFPPNKIRSLVFVNGIRFVFKMKHSWIYFWSKELKLRRNTWNWTINYMPNDFHPSAELLFGKHFKAKAMLD